MEIKDFIEFADLLSNGTPTAIIAILMAIIVCLIFERKDLLNKNERLDSKIDKHLEDYRQDFVFLSNSLDSIKMVLLDFRKKF